MLLSLTAAALCSSICALCVALRTSARSQSKRLAALSTRCAELEQELDEIRSELMKALNRERARANMAKLRASQKATESDAPGGSSHNGFSFGGPAATATDAEKDEWTRKMNLAIMRGEVKMPGRR